MSKWIISAKINDETVTSIILVMENLDQYEVRQEFSAKMGNLGFFKGDFHTVQYKEYNADGTLRSNEDPTVKPKPKPKSKPAADKAGA